METAKAVQPVQIGGCEQYRPLIRKYQWDERIAMAVMQQESQCDPASANRNDVHKDAQGNIICMGSFGLMQISCHSGEVFDPEENMAIAWSKYQRGGWLPWGAYTSGEYIKYLK